MKMSKERYEIDEQTGEILDNHFVITPEDVVDRLNYLEEQLANAIVPKFKIGDKVYGIIDTWAYTDVFPVEIRGTHLSYEVWDGEDTTKQHSTRIFATEEEAIKKLQELKGKVEDVKDYKD